LISGHVIDIFCHPRSTLQRGHNRQTTSLAD
jgi:hypothetical protein